MFICSKSAKKTSGWAMFLNFLIADRAAKHDDTVLVTFGHFRLSWIHTPRNLFSDSF